MDIFFVRWPLLSGKQAETHTQTSSIKSIKGSMVDLPVLIGVPEVVVLTSGLMKEENSDDVVKNKKYNVVLERANPVVWKD